MLGLEVEPVLRQQLVSIDAPLNDPALSIALASVCWIDEVNPLRRRRRGWTWPAWRSDRPSEIQKAEASQAAGHGLIAPMG